jgi:hypothetical protein
MGEWLLGAKGRELKDQLEGELYEQRNSRGAEKIERREGPQQLSNKL